MANHTIRSVRHFFVTSIKVIYLPDIESITKLFVRLRICDKEQEHRRFHLSQASLLYKPHLEVLFSIFSASIFARPQVLSA